tara:strand:+ start:454 stop:639 length:186 start_codon:yes stop_codon:yes gene_type:complete
METNKSNKSKVKKLLNFLKRRLNPMNTEFNYSNMGKHAKNKSFTDMFKDTSNNYRNMGKKQ